MTKQDLSEGTLFERSRTIYQILNRIPYVAKYLTLSFRRKEFLGSYLVSIAPEDPVSNLWSSFQNGTSLCAIYNLQTDLQQLNLLLDPTASLNLCKASVYHFLLGCRKILMIGDDALFSISELYSDDTNGFVKVLNTVQILLGNLITQNIISNERVQSIEPSSSTERPSQHAKIVMEIRETEKRFVNDLNRLQDYLRRILEQELIASDLLYDILSNLNGLIDFQQKFLVKIEATSEIEEQKQRFGLLFLSSESYFNVYEPFCTNYSAISELIIEESSNLSKLPDVIDPSYELPSLLIKPVQRICKYPLFLKELIKVTSEDDPYFTELSDGLEAMQRVTNRINEMQRKQENELIVADLRKRVDDWKGYSIGSFGVLILGDTFIVSKGDLEREYRVFLFEKILLCCKESPNKKQHISLTLSRRSKRTNSFQLKGRILIENITYIRSILVNGIPSIQIYWRGDIEEESFVLICKTEEKMKTWIDKLAKVLESSRNSPQLSVSSKMFEISDKELISLSSMRNYRGSISRKSADYGQFDKKTHENMLRLSQNREGFPQKTFRHPSMNIERLAEEKDLNSPNDINRAIDSTDKRNNGMKYFNERFPTRESEDVRAPISSSLNKSDHYDIPLQKSFKPSKDLLCVKINFEQLYTKIERKLRFCGNIIEERSLHLKYIDEDDDFITIKSDDDLSMAMDTISCLDSENEETSALVVYAFTRKI